MIIALDLATVVGYAMAPPPYRAAPTPVEIAAGAEIPKRFSGSKSFRHCNGEIGRIGSQFEEWLNELVAVNKPEMVVFEAPYIGAIRNANTARILLGMCVLTEVVCYRRGIYCLECNNSMVKKHAGHGRNTKKDMVRLARERGWDPKDDNEADALWLLDHACSLRAMPKARAG